MSELTKHAYVRYSEAAVEHLFAVASGLDSAVIGEQQVLGQVRRAYATAEANQTVGRVLHDLAQRALSVGKRVHVETAIDTAGASVVSVALDIAGRRLDGLAGRTAAVVGAGSMGGLSVAHLVRAGIDHIDVVNRSLPRAMRLAEKVRDHGVSAHAYPLDQLSAVMAAADVVVSCTGAVRPVVSLADVHQALAPAQRDDDNRPLVLCDLGMPRDIDPAVAGCRCLGRRYGTNLAGAVGQSSRDRRGRGAADRRRRGRRLPGRAADGRGHTDCHGPASARRRRCRERAAEAGKSAARPQRQPAQRSCAHRSPGCRQAAARPHSPDQTVGGAPGGRQLRRALRELFELDPQAVDAVAAGELPLLATEFDARRMDGDG